MQNLVPKLSKVVWLSALAAVLVLGFVLISHRAIAQNGRDCDSNAVITCGALSINELKLKYAENKGNIQAIYRAFGINSINDFNGMIIGRVGGNGQVFAGNTLVATNALTAGRQNMPGSTSIAGGLAFMRPPATSFVNPNGSLQALIKMSGGSFRFAVITSCGNPVKAVPIPARPPPVRTASFIINKQVRLHGQTAWLKDVTAKNNQLVDFRVIIKNTGQTTLTNIAFRDVIPNGLNGVNGTFAIGNQVISGSFTNQGTIRATIGSLAVGQQTVISFTTRVNNSVQACGGARLVNTAFAKPSGLNQKSSSATVQVCRQAPKVVIINKTVIKNENVNKVVNTPPAVQSAQTVAPTSTALPNTGAGDLFTIFFLVSSSAAFWHRFILPFVKRLTY